MARRLLVEAFGTAMLTIVAAGLEMAAELRPGHVDDVAKAAGPGLFVMAMIYAAGDVSGAHFNPAVTFAFALRRSFPWRLVPAYWAAQLTGATIGSFILRALFGTVAHGGVTPLHVNPGRAVVLEVVVSTILVTVILNTATRHRVVGSDAALAVGATITLCGLFAGPLSGASMNPARSLGPAVAAWYWSHAWVPIAGAFAGATLAALMSLAFHPAHGPDERAAAKGDGQR